MNNTAGRKFFSRPFFLLWTLLVGLQSAPVTFAAEPAAKPVTTAADAQASIATVDDLFDEAERRMQKAVETLKQDVASLRVDQASAALVDRITVDYYGTPTPLNQVATISVPEARLLVIQPWDRKLLSDIEKAIRNSALGINPNNDGQVIRLAIPPFTEERRRELVKTLHKKLDEHKVVVRNVRRNVQDNLQDRVKKKEVSEDELKRSTERLQKLTDRYIEEMNKIGQAKEKEIL
ncbi:ribosome recycling factor [Nostoc sp. TCL240-02]|uniref:ribosome recycling factor n=1 Tax=Nostoc sp. TCL240-02 TaxID=2572090 RepID=UPI00157FA8DA|nr:ribosome recycling factor [Nostoc sp. TCL240-02]QKQ73209.1 ribosome recycling factor [Nostoc sp. TCL240-02]